MFFAQGWLGLSHWLNYYHVCFHSRLVPRLRLLIAPLLPFHFQELLGALLPLELLSGLTPLSAVELDVHVLHMVHPGATTSHEPGR